MHIQVNKYFTHSSAEAFASYGQLRTAIWDHFLWVGCGVESIALACEEHNILYSNIHWVKLMSDVFLPVGLETATSTIFSKKT